MSALGLKGGDTIELIDGKKATNSRMKQLVRRVRPHTGTLLVYRQSEGVAFEVPYQVERL
jgi:hypothetical protein